MILSKVLSSLRLVPYSSFILKGQFFLQFKVVILIQLFHKNYQRTQMQPKVRPGIVNSQVEVIILGNQTNMAINPYTAGMGPQKNNYGNTPNLLKSQTNQQSTTGCLNYILQSAKQNPKTTIGLCVLAVCVLGAVAAILWYFLRPLPGTTYDLVLLDDPQAKCLDGSPGAYYISKDGDRNKFLVWFQGGGWCGGADGPATLESCYSRIGTGLGGSSGYDKQLYLEYGISSTLQKYLFKNWTKVILKYCDGSGHQGRQQLPQSYNGISMYFRGDDITKAQFSSLQQKYSLFTQVTDIIVSGTSAGGLAAYMWANYVKDNAIATVFAYPDGGVFLDEVNTLTSQHQYLNNFISLMQYTNVEIDPPVPECVALQTGSVENCFLAENIYQHLRVPVFAAQSLYDYWQIKNILGIDCVEGQNSLANCDAAQLTVIHDYRLKVSTLLIQIANFAPQNGAWAPACLWHAFLGHGFDSNIFRVPENSQNTLPYSFTQWLNGNQVVNVDTVDWPDNGPCSNYP